MFGHAARVIRVGPAGLVPATGAVVTALVALAVVELAL